MNCVKCVCNHCVYNAEIGLSWFTPGEVDDVDKLCFHCGECYIFDGNFKKFNMKRKECDKFQEASKVTEAVIRQEENKARRMRARFVIVKGMKYENPETRQG